MIDRRQFCTLTGSAILALTQRGLYAETTSQDAAGTVSREFILEAPLGNPFFSWPTTLLSYPIREVGAITPNTHRLLCTETGKAVPFQIANTSGRPAELLFFSDLPTGQKRTYRLTPTNGPASPSDTERHLVVTHEKEYVTIDTGQMQVRIPTSQTIVSDAPGPILEVSRGGKWTGSSLLTLADHLFISLQTEEVEAGPLRSSHRLTYTSDSGFLYVATVQCSAGMDFVRLHEDMESLPAGVQGEFKFTWSGSKFEYRQCPYHPSAFPSRPAAKYTDYSWEPIAPDYVETPFGVAPGMVDSVKIPFSLAPFEPWTDLQAASFANFWSNSSADAAAIFIDHIEEWNDHQYSIWHSMEGWNDLDYAGWQASPRIAVDFLYVADALHFIYKLTKGSRSSCLCFYDHAKDLDAMKRVEQMASGINWNGQIHRSGVFPVSHALNLQNWFGTLNLDKTKDWTLSYQAHGKAPQPTFNSAPRKNAWQSNDSMSVSDYTRLLLPSDDFFSQIAIAGTRQSHGFGPTSSRALLETWIPGYQYFRSQMSEPDRRQIEAMLLFLAYLHAGEDYMPMRYMLAGHPNFLSDVKSVPPGISFLFPDHPAADAWSDEYEAYLHLNARYHTRPHVKSWDAQGGRWTENLGTYVWAFLRPALEASFLLKRRDGYERFSAPQLVDLGDWLVNALSAPFHGENSGVLKYITEQSKTSRGAALHYWGVVSPADGARRLHPPIGAHSERRKTPRSMWYMGKALRNYSPLTAEHLMWAARPTDRDMEAPPSGDDLYAAMYEGPDNRGTNPHLRSAKYTGYGITLRDAVDTPEEISIHLIQIDSGPNYRWGVPSEGSCGTVYFYAAGKGYSHNGTEDSGDRNDHDTDFTSNFGVWKNNTFRGIGQNVLSSPFYNLRFAQFARIAPRQGPSPYSFPEYVSRSILLAGNDYFVLHDRVLTPRVSHRLSWFVRKGDDFPHITILQPSPHNENVAMTSVETETTLGRWWDGTGDSLALITHKEGITAESTIFGARITTPNGNDLLFASAGPSEFHEGKTRFSGTAGLIRHRREGIELALFHGTLIAAEDFSFATTDTALGISAKLSGKGAAWGFFFAPNPATVKITVPDSKQFSFFIDGQKTDLPSESNALSIHIPRGEHNWEWTSGLPKPSAPLVSHTEHVDGGAIVHGIPVAAASSYDLELSADGASTWTLRGQASEPLFKLSGLSNGKKYHVRLSARNSDHGSEPGPEYPLYVTHDVPPAPDGLHIELSAGAATLTWGQVLGVGEYHVYKKNPSEDQFREIYKGTANMFKDVDSTIVASADYPLDSASDHKSQPHFIEYHVSSANSNGESTPSRAVNTNAASWRNWNPTPGEPFRRTSKRTEGPLPEDSLDRYYPQ